MNRNLAPGMANAQPTAAACRGSYPSAERQNAGMSLLTGWARSGRLFPVVDAATTHHLPVEWWHPARIEGLQVNRMCGTIDDQLRHRLAGCRRVQDTPDAVTGGDIGIGNSGHGTDERQSIAGDRTVARLPRHNP